MDNASSVRNSERSPGSPPAVTLSTAPDANPAARLIDRPEAPNWVSTARTTERSSSNSFASRRNNDRSSALWCVEARRCTTRMATSDAAQMVAKIGDESLASSCRRLERRAGVPPRRQPGRGGDDTKHARAAPVASRAVSTCSADLITWSIMPLRQRCRPNESTDFGSCRRSPQAGHIDRRPIVGLQADRASHWEPTRWLSRQTRARPSCDAVRPASRRA